MVHTVNMKVDAKSVKKAKQLSFLKNKGCDGVQGFLLRSRTFSQDYRMAFLVAMIKVVLAHFYVSARHGPARFKASGSSLDICPKT